VGEDLYAQRADRYAAARRADPRIAAALRDALGDARTIANVGAGTGSYEPADGSIVVAVDPSQAMLRQRSARLAPAVRARAEALPLGPASVDACLAVLTLHHWSDWRAGLAELARVSRRRVVVLTWDPRAGFWLDDYFPELAAFDRRIFPDIDDVRRGFGAASVRPLSIPHDCTDGFLGAYWRRPEAYLDPDVRAAISTFARVPAGDAGLRRLHDDLASGAWDRRYGRLRSLPELDVGYRVVALET
jgi:SAM-dependent methyltransferase